MLPGTHDIYMRRCIQLARLGAGNVAPNPMVGAVLVYQGRIIGEGYHELYGKAHAEVNCIRSVTKQDEALISRSVLYVSLEPCAHFGKTPPCADLIIEKKIPQVIIGCRDPFPAVNGKGIEKLKAAGVSVETGIMEQDCLALNKRFFSFHKHHRPYIILKWAQTQNGIIGADSPSRLMISNWYSNHLVHKWRSEEAAIMVGTRTAAMDDPSLTTRLWPGNNPLRIVIDLELSLPATLQLFDHTVPTLVFNRLQNSIENFSDKTFITEGKTAYYQVTKDVSIVQQVLNALYHMNIQSLIVEGGAKLLQSFIDEQAWNEARVISNNQIAVAEGIAAPQLLATTLISSEEFAGDTIRYFENPLVQKQ